MAIQPDGKIVVVGEGFTSESDWWDFAVVRYNPDCSLDNSFARGVVDTPVGNSGDIAFAVLKRRKYKLTQPARSPRRPDENRHHERWCGPTVSCRF